MTGNYVFRFDTVSVGPLGKAVIDLGQLIEGHITAAVIEETPVEDDDLPTPGPGPGHIPPRPPRPVTPRDFKLELLRAGTVAGKATGASLSVVNDSPAPWQVRLTSTLKQKGASFRVRTQVPVVEPFATLEARITLDGSKGGTVRSWSAVSALPPHTGGQFTAQTVGGPFGAQITLGFMLGPQVIATARNALLAFNTGTGNPPLTLRVKCDAPPSTTTAVTVRITYPSTQRILTKQIPLEFFTRVFDEFWNLRIPQPLSLNITDHKLFIEFDPELARAQGLSNITAPLPAMSVPFIGNDVRIMGLFSKRIQLSTGIGPNPLAKILVPPDPPLKYPQAAFFAIDVEFEGTSPRLDVNISPDVSLSGVSLHLELYLSTIGDSLFFFPNAVVSIKSASVAHVGIAGTIASVANSKINDALSRNIAMGQLGKAIRPWLLGGAFTINAAGSRFGEIWIDYIEPLPVPAPAIVRVPVKPGNLAKIDHILVLMMENRSFDHMMGYLSLPGGRPTGKPVNGLRGGELNKFRGKDFPSHLLDKTFLPFSPCHGFICTQHQVSDNMGGFVASFAEHDEALGADISAVMGHYDGKLLPVYDQLAAQFALCDRWHAAHPGPTWPNRFITVSGHLNKDAFDQFEFDNPNLGTFAPSLAENIFDVLSANGVSWRYYENGYSFARLFARHTFDVKNVLGFSSFLRDAAAGALPSVSFIDPDFIEFPPGADDQAPSDPIDGQRFVGTVVNALLASPNWAKTLLIVTYDEHGGFYDHVPPPPTPVKFEADMDRYGLRVPTFLVSPFVEPGDVPKQLFDHASIQASIQRRFLGPQAPDLGPRVAKAADVGAALTRSAPRTGLPALTLPPESANRRRIRPASQPFPSQQSGEFNDLLFLARMFTGIGPK